MIQNLIFGMFSTDMGIDLGTANTLVYVSGKGIVLDEPSVVAVRKGKREVLLNGNAVGIEAKKMLGLAPPGIEVVRPLRNGVIADFDITKALIEYFIRKVHQRRWGYRPRVVIAVPSGITEVEKRAVINSAERAGARRVYLIDEPKAAGIGAGLHVEEPQGNMIVDIGGGTTEVAVMSLAGLVESESLRVSGDRMDEAIIEHMKLTYNMNIGERTAEQIKISIGSAFQLKQELKMEVKGRDSVVNMPRKVIITSEEIRVAISEPVTLIVNAIKKVLERTPPEVSADLVDTGMTLCGGGALLKGIDRVIYEQTGLPVRIAEDPLTCVVRGTGIILEHPELMEILDSSAVDE